MNDSSIRVAVVGASGYTGEELLRVLISHPRMKLSAVTSRQNEGQSLNQFMGAKNLYPDLKFKNLSADELIERADVFFLALPHGVAAKYMVPLRTARKIVLDLSADFRMKDPVVYEEFYGKKHPAPELLEQAVYGNPEIYGEALKTADLIACPGCYPTSILLALAPALKKGLLDTDHINITSMSGVSGAGKKAELGFSFCELNESVKPYGVPKHRHICEIEQELSHLAGHMLRITFVPHLIPVQRGMLSTITCPATTNINDSQLISLYQDFYKDSPFVHVLENGDLPETRRVVRTNNCQMALRYDARTNRIIAMSAIDNLGKGAATQAVQCLNQRFGFSQWEGLTS
ncbi:MAG: N-acetyl-gamma-glutamyl-phosphate reductase [Verrucomicrobiota bacterium]